MKAVAEAIIELARDSRYVGGTVTEKSITPRPRSIQRSFRIGCATQKLFIRYQKEGRSTEDPFFPATNGLRSAIYFRRTIPRRAVRPKDTARRGAQARFLAASMTYIFCGSAPRRGTMPATEGEPGLTHDRTAW